MMKSRLIRNAVPTFLILFCSFQSMARLATDADLNSLVELDSAAFDIKKDGTFTLDIETQTHVLTEAGRDAEAVQKVSFNSRASNFELLAAKTITEGREVKVPKENIEIKEVGDAKVFDTTKEAIIAFPSVRVGSKIYLKYRLKYHEVPFDGFFSSGLLLSLQNVDVLKRRFRSELPLFTASKKAGDILKIEESKEGSRYIVEISSREKIRLKVVQEDSEFVENGRMPMVIVSSRKDWSGFAAEIIKAQEKMLSAPLPPEFEKIRAAAEKEPAERRMAVVASQVSQEIRYFGDWRRRNGGHMPRSLKEIADTGYGDCKEMSLAVVAIARALGLQADLTWVWRSELDLDDSYYVLPNDFAFNHAVARVVVANGKIEWIDATNPVAVPGLVFADIAQRPALVLAKTGGYLAKLPPLKSSEAKTRVELQLSMRKGGTFDVEGLLMQAGRAAIHAGWALIYVPSEQFKYDTVRWLARSEKVESYEMTTPKSTGRIIGDLTFKTKFTLADLGLQTSAGVGFPLLRNDAVDALMIDVRERFSDLWLATPGIMEVDYKFPGARIVGSYSLDCDLQSEWINMSRKVKSVRNGVEVIWKQEIKSSVIPNRALLSKEYAKFQSEVRRCFNRSAVILSSKPSALKSR